MSGQVDMLPKFGGECVVTGCHDGLPSRLYVESLKYMISIVFTLCFENKIF